MTDSPHDPSCPEAPPPDAPAPPPVPAAPVTAAERLESLDVLRGFAVLGILAMNVQTFSDVSATYMNPALRGMPGGLDAILWGAARILADSKFMTLFSLMFGAGILLFSSRLEARGRKPAGLHYRRMLWLWVIGMVHGYLLWYGDILVPYALCGLVVYLLRKVRPSRQIILGVLAIAVPSLGMLGFQAILPHMPPEVLAGMREAWEPEAADVAREVAAMQGGLLQQLPFRAQETLFMHLGGMVFFVGWRVSGLMLIGMALLKTGVLGAERSSRFYRGLLMAGAGLGLPLIVAGVVFDWRAGFAMERSMLLGSQFNYWGSIGLALAYAAAVMLVVQAGALAGLRRRLAAAGRMAFSNYLGQTVIGTLVFYGHGLGLFARTAAWQDALLVVAVWCLQLWFSPWWLARFRFGPMEWLWRSLTYWRPQRLRREPAVAVVGGAASPPSSPPPSAGPGA